MKRLLLLLLVLSVTVPALAQTATPTSTPLPTSTLPTRTARPTNIPGECGNGLPCGPLPWRLPQLPRLQSPTPFPTSLYVQTVTPTWTPTWTPGGPTATRTATLTPSATMRPTDELNIEELENQIATLRAQIEATQRPVVVGGTEVQFATEFIELGSGSSTLFGYLRGVTTVYTGPFAPLLSVTLLGFGMIIIMQLIKLTLPTLALFFGFIRKAVQLLLDFLPF